MIIAFWVNIGVPLFWETTISCQRRGEQDASAFTSAGAHQICSLFLAADSGVCAAIPCNCSKNQNVVDPCFVRASGTGLAFAQSWLGDHHNTKNNRHKDNDRNIYLNCQKTRQKLRSLREHPILMFNFGLFTPKTWSEERFPQLARQLRLWNLPCLENIVNNKGSKNNYNTYNTSNNN